MMGAFCGRGMGSPGFVGQTQPRPCEAFQVEFTARTAPKSKHLKPMKYQLHFPAPGHNKHTENLLIPPLNHFLIVSAAVTIGPGSERVPCPHGNTTQHTGLPQR